MPTIRERFRKSWNAFLGRDPTTTSTDPSIKIDYGYGTSYKPDRRYRSLQSSRTIVASIQNRIAMDVAAIDMMHVKLDSAGRFKEVVDDGLNQCLTVEANVDQTGRAFIQDVVMSMFDEGVVAIVPTNAEVNATRDQILDVYSMRTGRIVSWYPKHVKIETYNEDTGKREMIVMPKSMVAIIENPLYSIMNEPNSTLQRLMRTISRLDMLNEQNSSGKLDLIIQLPYVIKSEERRKQANARRQDIVDQLTDSKYGIAYTDGTERITQLNRSLDNNLWQQVTELTNQLYNELGLTTSIFDGTANEQTMINYNNRTIEPICAVIAEEMIRKFLTKTARSQKESVKYFRDPFKLVPVSQLAEIADKFTRNEILSSNEIRAEVGFKPSEDPRADQLINSNLNTSDEQLAANPDLARGAPVSEEGELEEEYEDGGTEDEDGEYDDLMRQIQSLSHSEVTWQRKKNRRRSKWR